MPTRLPIFTFRVRFRAEKRLRQKKKKIHLELSRVDADCIAELFIIYRPHDVFCTVTLFGHINKQRRREENETALRFFFFPLLK